MKDNAPPITERSFSSQDMVNASELREFLYCERAWFLGSQGYIVSAQAQTQRNAGTQFHEARAAAAYQGSRSWPVGWAIILAAIGIAILLFELWSGGR